MYRWFRVSAALSLSLLCGCSIFDTAGGSSDAGDAAAALPGIPQDPVRFELRYPVQSVMGELQMVTVEGENTLSDLARAYGLGYDEVVAANPGVNPWVPGIGTRVLLPTQYVLPPVRDGIVLNIAAKRLYYFTEEDGQEIVYTFPMGIGRVGWETPVGSTTVVAKAKDPSWYVPWSVQQEHKAMGDPLPAVVPPGPDNPLGAHVLKLDMPGYLIHGTNQPYGVGMRVSHGCVRLYPENIEFLFGKVGVGTQVTIVNEPFLLGERDGELFFEAHQPLEDDPVDADARLTRTVDRFAAAYGIRLPERATEHVTSISATGHGVPVRVYTYDTAEYLTRATLVANTVTADPEAPTLEEVRDMIDSVMTADDEDAGAEARTANRGELAGGVE
jgi:L,D-transpeptidase ErfK/SrfK